MRYHRHRRHEGLCTGHFGRVKRLEYRGYDPRASPRWWTAISSGAGRRASLSNSAKRWHDIPFRTYRHRPHALGPHGKPSEINAHPHASERVAIVHNGIIENFREPRAELLAKGHKFESETDSEVCAHLITDYLQQGLIPEEAAKAAVKRLTGAYSLAMIFKGEEGLLIGARMGSPLAVGYGTTKPISAPTLSRWRLSPTGSPISKTGMSPCCAAPTSRSMTQGSSRQPRSENHHVPRPVSSTRPATAISWEGNPRTARRHRPHGVALRRSGGAARNCARSRPSKP